MTTPEQVYTLALDKKEFGAFSSVDEDTKLTDVSAITSESHGIFAAGNRIIAANSILTQVAEEEPSPQ